MKNTRPRRAVLLLAIVLLCLALPAPGRTPASVPSAGGALRWRAGDILTPDFVSDSDANDSKPGPVRIVAARNGRFSGKVVLSSAGPIRSLSVRPGELKGASGTIPASAIQVRYALPWGQVVTNQAREGEEPRYLPRSGYLGLLAETPLPEFPLRKVEGRRGAAATYGPVVPIWFTLTVPRTAAAGDYTGPITIQAGGSGPLAIPIELKIVPWTLPDPAAWQTWVDAFESPDTLALEYGVEPWSRKHWDLIARSFRLLCGLGNRTVYVPLIGHTNVGHEQSMVRWVKKAGGGYDLDFSILEEYLDTAMKEMGKPQVVVLYVWENYMIRQDDVATGAAAAHEQQRILDQMQKEGGILGKGPAVTVLDPATKAVQLEYLPHYTDAASKALWKPLFAELGRRLEKRGLAKAAMLGMLNDCWSTKAEVEFFKDLAPDMPWVLHAHFGKADAYGLAKVGYRAQVWSIEGPARGKSRAGWKRPDLLARFVRDAEFGAAPLHTWRFWGEYCIAGNQRGVARLGGDYWPVLKDKAGQRTGRAGERYPESTWRNLGIYTSLLAPDSNAPVATPRLEVFREGLQECEARIVLEKALGDAAARARLGDDLARRCQDALDERLERMLENMSTKPGNRCGWSWTLRSGWQERSERLFTLAGEASARMGGLP